MRMMGRQTLVHKCQCVSMKPGMQIMPRASIDAMMGASISAAMATIAPLRTCTSPRARSPILRSMVSTVAPRMTNSPRLGSGFADVVVREAGSLACAKSAPAAAPVTPASMDLRIVRRLLRMLLPKKTSLARFSFPRRFGDRVARRDATERQALSDVACALVEIAVDRAQLARAVEPRDARVVGTNDLRVLIAARTALGVEHGRRELDCIEGRRG